MKKYLILALVLTSQIACMAQSVQNCYVKEYNDKKAKTPLANVEIVARNAGSAVSGKKGEFQLSFRTLKPGDKVELIKASKEKYEIFNIDAVNEWRIANDGSAFTIVMCKSAKFKALKDQYNATASESYARQKKHDEAELKRQLDEGKMQADEYEQKLIEMEEEYEKRLGNLATYVDRFARIDLSELSAEEQAIVELVQAGKIDEAVEAYEKMNLVGQIEKIGKEKAEVDQAIAKLQTKSDEMNKEQQGLYAMIKNEIAVLGMRGGKESYDRIMFLVESAANTLKTPDLYLQCASMAIEQRLFDKAHYWNAKLLESVDSTSDYYSEALYNFAITYSWQSNVDSFLLYSKPALRRIGKLGKNPSLHQIEMNVNLWVQTGNMHKSKMEFDESIAAFKKAIAICSYADSVGIPKDSTLKTRSVITNALANLYWKTGKYENAFNVCNDIVNELKDGVSRNIIDTRSLALILANMANAQRYMFNYDKSLAYYKESIELLKKLYEKNPSAYIFAYSQILSNSAAIYFFQGNMDEALKMFEEVMLLYKVASVDGSFDTKFSYLMGLNNCGYVSFGMKDYAKAEKYLLEGKEYAKELPEAQYKTTIVEVNRLNVNLMSLYLAMGKYDKCAEYDTLCQREAEFLYEALKDGYFDTYLLTYCNHAEFLARNGNMDEALKVWNDVLAKDPEYVKHHPETPFVKYLKEKGHIKE